jgi:cell division initiation protein
MAVSPEEIQNKEFREAFRGYNEDDVDTFLDEVAVEFSRLYHENQRMKVQLAALQQEVARLGDSRERPAAAAPSPPVKDDSRVEAARQAAEAALEEAKRRASDLVQRAELRAREIDELTARRAKDVDADASAALTDAQQRLVELRRQEAEVTARLRNFLEQQLATLSSSVDLDAGSSRSPVAEHMARELGPGEQERAPQGASSEAFWRGE